MRILDDDEIYIAILNHWTKLWLYWAKLSGAFNNESILGSLYSNQPKGSIAAL